MVKIMCHKTSKGLWLTKAIMDNMRTLKLLGVDIIEAPAVDFNHSGKRHTHHMGNYYSAEYIGDNKWRFHIEPVTQMRFR